MINCDECKFKCEKSANFKKHLLNKHKEDFLSLFDLEKFYIKKIYFIEKEELDLFISLYLKKETSIRLFCKNKNISFSVIASLLKSNNIEIFSSKEMSGLDFVLQNKEKTFLKNYGIKNNFGDKNILKKAKENVDYKKISISTKKNLYEKYGVTNVAQIPHVKKKISDSHKKLQEKLSYDEKLKRTEKARSSLKYISKLELRIQEILNEMNVTYTKNGFIYRYNFDLIFKNKIILEIQGDFWHANPLYYKESDIILKTLKVSDIWFKDKRKKEKVEKNGWKIYYLWENEINNMTDLQIKKYLLNILNLN